MAPSGSVATIVDDGSAQTTLWKERILMPVQFQVTFDAADPQRLSAFWRQALGYREQSPPEGYATWEDWARAMQVPEETWGNYAALVDPEGVRPRLFVQRVPEPKTAKNRVHLDVNVSGPPEVARDQRRPRVDAEVKRLVGLGASMIRPYDELDQYWVVMQDPEGNEFCLQ
jgi:hypothetical protein